MLLVCKFIASPRSDQSGLPHPPITPLEGSLLIVVLNIRPHYLLVTLLRKVSTTEMKMKSPRFTLTHSRIYSRIRIHWDRTLLPQAGNSNQLWSDHGADCLLFEKCLNAYCRGNAALSYLPFHVSAPYITFENKHAFQKLGVFPARSCREREKKI